MAASVIHKKVRWPSYQIKRLDNGANFGSLRSRQCRQKARKARRRDVLSPPGKFSPMAQRWILFLRASYFRSRYNKVPSFDKTSSHEFPATWENVNTEGWRVATYVEKSALYGIDGKRAGIFRLARKTFGNFSLRGKPRVVQGVSDYRPFQCNDWNIWRPDFFSGEGICLTFGGTNRNAKFWNVVLLIVKYKWQLYFIKDLE